MSELKKYYLTQVVTYESPLSKFVILNEVKELQKPNDSKCCKKERFWGKGSCVDPSLRSG